MKANSAKSYRGVMPLFACCLLVALAVGCGESGPPLGTVQGTVTLDGQPLAEAELMFMSDVGGASLGMTDAEGRYSLWYAGGSQGAVVGSHVVTITTAITESDGEGNETTRLERVPAKYNVETTLTADVQEGDNTFDFHLQSQ